MLFTLLRYFVIMKKWGEMKGGTVRDSTEHEEEIAPGSENNKRICEYILIGMFMP